MFLQKDKEVPRGRLVNLSSRWPLRLRQRARACGGDKGGEVCGARQMRAGLGCSKVDREALEGFKQETTSVVLI